ncbi:prepilin-type N-terminal cleavage/methylation domain-containing protein [Candidatus Sumerlaeota bacterium]|nr:prepilin-type N-terminal cleavage/methylation domain-containing protein [Candidatus Sumerlaeota bacterium]
MRRQNRRGFTAVEIAMVASIIAIIALLILPIFRQRAEEARKVAVQDELQSLTKALLLVEADMPGGGFLPRLNDLDNPENTGLTALSTPTPGFDPPRARWVPGTPGRFDVINPPARYFSTVVPNWKGPYVAMKNTMSLQEVLTGFIQTTDRRQGPIAIFDTTSAVPPADQIDGDLANNTDRYPKDPWGSPYILFGPEETVYNSRAVYSMGPNQLPGLLPNPAPPDSDYDRRNGVLGAPNSDDYFFIF